MSLRKVTNFDKQYIPPDVDFHDDDNWYDDDTEGELRCMCPLCVCMATVNERNGLICDSCRSGGHQG